MPFAPALGFNVGLHLAIQKDHAGIRSPWPAQKNVLHARLGRDLAMVEHKPALLLRVAFALRREHDDGMRNRMDLALDEYCLGIAKDEVHVALDIAMREKLARRGAGALLAGAALAAGVKRVLGAKHPHIMKNGPIPGDGQRYRLRSL